MSLYFCDGTLEDNSGRIWFGSRYGDRFGFFHNDEVEIFDEGATFPVRVGAMELDADGRVWVGSANVSGGQGLFEYDDGREFLHRVKLDCPVSALCADAEERLWIGTNQGLKMHDGTDVHTFTTRQGLSCDIVTCIKESRDGKFLLIGTEGGGVNLYDGKTFQSLQYAANPALNVINDIIEGRCGDLWFATEGGLIQYSPTGEPGNVSMIRMTADRTLVRPAEVEVSAATPDIRFEFEAYSEADDSRDLVFRYRLTGYDQDWAQSRDNSVCYSRLSIGEYDFKVQAVDRDLNYSPAVNTRVNVHADPKIATFNEALTQGKGEFVGKSARITAVLSQIRDVASNDVTTLIRGETGAGKGLAARAIHEMSQRADGPFVQVNCGALSEALIDSELFGHERGAFTGAVARKVGKFELADGGTIFLDEIGDLPPASQARLLHVLQEFTIERVGGTELIPIDVRVIAATNRDLPKAINEGSFRTDLYYRLNAYTIDVPVLSDRSEDIPKLARHFVTRFSAHLNVAEPQIAPEAMRQLVRYDWPGNVRELEHMMQRAVILTKGENIQPQHLAIGLAASSEEHTGKSPIEPLHEFERRYLTRVLELTGGVIYGESGAAALLEIHPNTLRSRLAKLGVKFGRVRESSAI